jgi:transposase
MALVELLQKLCVVAMETCLRTHFVNRTLRTLGPEPRIIPAICIKPFLKGQKNDYDDAEAALRPNLRIVREKSQDQLDLQACHPDPLDQEARQLPRPAPLRLRYLLLALCPTGIGS